MPEEKETQPWVAPDGSLAYSENAYWNKRAMLEKKAVRCADCKLLWHPICMTLDHRRRESKWVTKNSGKRINPSHMLTYDQQRYRDMLNGLDAVCSNCHKLREARRDNIISRPIWQKWTAKLTNLGGLISE